MDIVHAAQLIFTHPEHFYDHRNMRHITTVQRRRIVEKTRDASLSRGRRKRRQAASRRGFRRHGQQQWLPRIDACPDPAHRQARVDFCAMMPVRVPGAMLGKGVPRARPGLPGRLPGTPALLMVCSDGIWDNWKFPDIVSHFATSEQEYMRPQTTATGVSGAGAGGTFDVDGTTQGADPDTVNLITRFMVVNKAEAHKNFGNSADNMSAVVCSIFPSI